MFEPELAERVPVTFNVGDWAKIIAAITTSELDPAVKGHLNTVIFDCVSEHQVVG